MKRIMLSCLFGLALVAGSMTTNTAKADHGCHHHHGGMSYNSYRPNYGGGYGNVYNRPVYPGYYGGGYPNYYGGGYGGMGFAGPRGNSIYFRW